MARSLSLALVLLLAVTALTGCTQTKHVSTSTDQSDSFAALNRNLEGRNVNLGLTDERIMPSTALLIRSDSTWMLDHVTGSVHRAATHEIDYVALRRPGRGAVQGAVFGAAAGAVVGLVSGFALSSSYRDSATAQESQAYFVSIPATFGAILGLGTGTLLGLRRGSWDRYEYPRIDMTYGAESAAPAESVNTAQRNR